MNCAEIQIHCHPYLDQQLEAARRQELEGHLAQCTPCAQAVDAQRAFLFTLKKLVVNCDQQAAPAQLHARIQSIAAEAPAAPQLQAVEQTSASRQPLRLRGAMAMAASVMLAFGGLIAAQSLCLTQACPLVLAAAHEHENIVAESRPVLARGGNLKHLTDAVKERICGVDGFPSLCGCKLNPLKCGIVKIEGLPEGAYVQYAECGHENDPITLMIVNSRAESGAEIVKVNDKEYRIARRGDHTVLSWRGEKDGNLYILVARRPLKESLEIAEIASN